MKRFLSWAVCCLLLANAAQGGTLVQFRTAVGDIEVELYDQAKPVTVQNFIRYIQAGLYRDSIMHRAVTNFVVQGGGVYNSGRGTTNAGLYYIPTFPPITNEFGVGPFLSNTYGTIAMAKTADPNSATSQYFFNLANNAASLDNTNNSGGFTVFGRVVGGTNVLNLLNAGSASSVINIANLGGVLAELPVLKPATAATVTYNDLVYVDISLLQVQIAASNNVRTISWNSIASQTNVVEYTTQLPPTWQTLISTNGDGTRFGVTDASADPNRFYRVRVVY